MFALIEIAVETARIIDKTELLFLSLTHSDRRIIDIINVRIRKKSGL